MVNGRIGKGPNARGRNETAKDEMGEGEVA